MRVIRADAALTAQPPASRPSDSYTCFTSLQVRPRCCHSRWGYKGKRLSSMAHIGEATQVHKQTHIGLEEDKTSDTLPAEAAREIEQRHLWAEKQRTFYSARTLSPSTEALLKVLKQRGKLNIQTKTTRAHPASCPPESRAEQSTNDQICPAPTLS